MKAYGIGPESGDFVRAGAGWPEHLQQACGHVSGSATHRLREQDLAGFDDAAFGWLAGQPLVAVLIDDLTATQTDPGAARLAAHLLAGRVEEPGGTTVLWRPTGPEELRLVEASGWTRWPPRLPDQPIFYPVLNEAYARQIALDWNVPASGTGHVTVFRVRTEFARRYPTMRAGGGHILELWVPAEDLDALNAQLVGPISLVTTYP